MSWGVGDAGKTIDTQQWRRYAYTGGQLSSVYDGADRLVEERGYSGGAGSSTLTASDAVTDVSWSAVGGGYVAHVVKASGATSDYTLRAIGDHYRVVDVRGDCACSVNDRVYGLDPGGMSPAVRIRGDLAFLRGM